MKAVRAKALMRELVSGLANDGNSKRIDNSEVFMPLYVGVSHDTQLGRVFYLVHYGEQYGDLMADPEMQFLRRKGEFYPILYRNDYVGAYQVSAEIEGTKIFVKERKQADQTKFANQWLKNIRRQQNL